MADNLMIGIDFSMASSEVISILLEDTSEPEIFYEIAEQNRNRPEILQLLYNHPALSEDIKVHISDILHLPAVVKKETVHAEIPEHTKPQNLITRIQSMPVSARIQLALKGGREIRGILVKDPNKEVMLSVLENMKITETEVEMIARSRSVPEEALRRISKNREWMKNYSIMFALVTNPKTPPGIAVTLVSNIKLKDLALLEKNKNVAEVIRNAAKRILMAKKSNR